MTNESILMTNDHELWTFHARSMFNPETSLPFMEGNHAKKIIIYHVACKGKWQKKPQDFYRISGPPRLARFWVSISCCKKNGQKIWNRI